MQALLERQSKSLESIDKTTRRDQIIQIAQLYEEKRLDKEGEDNLDQLKSLTKVVEKINDKTGDGLNSNVIRLFKEIQKVSGSLNTRPLNDPEVKGITGAAMDRRQYDTLKPRVERAKEGVKDFFTMRGFLDKTGIVPRKSGGIVSEYLDRGEDKKKYVEQRMKTKGTTFGSRESFGKQFDAQQNIQSDINKNEKEIKSLRESGATDIGLKRSGLLDKRAELATNLAKVDPSVRPAGFDPKTGKVKDPKEPQTAAEQETSAQGKGSAKVIPFSTDKPAAAGLAGEESMLEQNRMVAEQSELLKKIEENTRSLKGGTQGSGTTQQPAAAEEAGGLGLSDMLPTKGIGRALKGAGRGLLGGAKALGRFGLAKAGPLAAIAAVGAGAYEGYQGFSAAGDKQETAKEDIKAKVASGEITQGEANKLEKQVNETATVEKSGAVGKGTGMAVGGAAGALKGAALGAAIGSVVPVLGTVVGGAIGATVGAIGGSYLGGKGGEWLGKKAGAVKNWASGLFGGGVTEDKITSSSSTSSESTFSESTFAKNDPENYAKFTQYRDTKTKEIAKGYAKSFNRKEPNDGDVTAALAEAKVDAISKFSKEIKAAGASQENKPQSADQQTKSADGTATGADKTYNKLAEQHKAAAGRADSVGGAGTISAARDAVGVKSPMTLDEVNAAKDSLRAGNATDTSLAPTATGADKTYNKLAARFESAAGRARSGDIISKQSGENEQAKLDAGKGGGTANIVSAPTVNNNTTQQTSSVKLQPRNNDSTINKYVNSRYAM